MTQAEIKTKIEKLKKAINVTDNTEDKKMLQDGLKKLESKLEPEKKPVKKVISKQPTVKKKVIIEKKPVKKVVPKKEDEYFIVINKTRHKHSSLEAAKKAVKKEFHHKIRPMSEWDKAGKEIEAEKKKPAPKKKLPLKKALKQPKQKDITISKGAKTETHKTGFDKDIKDAVLVLNKARYKIKEVTDRKTKKVSKVKHSAAYRNARTIEKRVNEIFSSSIYDIAKTRKEKTAKKEFIAEINQVKDLTTLWLNEVDMIINQEAKSDLTAIKKLLIGLIKEAQKNDPDDKYKLAGGLDKIAKKYGF